jgi:hypothetical protein
VLTACGNGSVETVNPETPAPIPQGNINLYGEWHGIEQIKRRQLELWHDYYHNEGMRHLFLEVPYFTAEFKNIWMREDNDDLMDMLLEDSKGTADDTPFRRVFFQTIKNEFPETVFHGTDVGHQHDTTGLRLLRYLAELGETDSERYRLTQESIEQGMTWNQTGNLEYRVSRMTENFIREFNSLEEQSIMAIHGALHTQLGAAETRGQTVVTMAQRLRDVYGDLLHIEDLTWLAAVPLRTDIITVNGTEYTASYFGVQDISWADGFDSREFWRLEDAYDDFRDAPKTGMYLPFDNYLMPVAVGQVFYVEYLLTDGSVIKRYFRSDGNHVGDARPITEEFLP